MSQKHRYFPALMIVLIFTFSFLVTQAQSNDLAATLEVLDAGVEVQRVNTANWIPVQVEAIVGVGDLIRTDATGRARITFFSDGIDTELTPDTEYRIVRFESTGESSFNLSVEVIAGQTIQRIGRALDANSNYDVSTPAMSLTARGTAFTIRVEDSGRSGMLVTEGEVEATGEEETTAQVPAQFGIRGGVNGTLSDVVRAATFDELDSALDGCSATVTTLDDVSINIRQGPNREAEVIGLISAEDINRFFGVTESGSWYRITFEGGFGWILSSTAVIEEGCPGLRQFTDDYLEGQATDPDPAEAEATPEATPEA
ncbi:MAG: FecR domain-containing protein [Anaerolineae bacterium]|jgi:hypothetical protein|nr:FecR domain-containing protein [Anaerolineae bacterium]